MRRLSYPSASCSGSAPMSLPRDFLDEIEIERAAARSTLIRSCTRTAALEELHRLARAATHELGRRVTVFDSSALRPHTANPRFGSHSFAECAQTCLN